MLYVFVIGSNKLNLTSDMTGLVVDGQTVEAWHHRGQPAFHPSGEYIAFQVMNEHASSSVPSDEMLSLGVNHDLWVMTSEGTHKQKLTDNPAGYSVLHAHFSHDGTKLVWAERYADNENASIFGAWRIRVADFAVDAIHNVTLSNIQVIQPSGDKWYETHGFSSDDETIIYSSNATTDFKASDLYKYDLSTGQLTNLTESPATWEEMYNANPANSSQHSFISSRFFDWDNDWGWATLRTELYLNDGGTITQLTNFNKAVDYQKSLTATRKFIGDNCWSPDGKSILAILAEVKITGTETKLVKIDLK